MDLRKSLVRGVRTGLLVAGLSLSLGMAVAPESGRGLLGIRKPGHAE